MKKQTAVDFLIEKIIIADVKGYSLQMSKLTEWAKEARQIEKQQIIDAIVWFDDTDRKPNEIELQAKEYYNENYEQ